MMIANSVSLHYLSWLFLSLYLALVRGRSDLTCREIVTTPPIDFHTYLESSNQLGILLNLPRNNAIVPRLFKMNNEMRALQKLARFEQAQVFSCFASKGFLFGTALDYANTQMFSVLYEPHFDLNEPGGIREFRDRFIPQLNCSRYYEQKQGDFGLKAEEDEILDLVYFLFCPSQTVYQTCPENSPLLQIIRSEEWKVSATLSQGVEMFFRHIVESDSYLGSQQTIAYHGMDCDMGLALRALHRPEARPLLRFLFAPRAGNSSSEKDQSNQALFYALSHLDLKDLPAYFNPFLLQQLMQLVHYERARVSHYLQHIAALYANTTRTAPAAFRSILHTFVAPLSLAEFKTLPPFFIADAFTANQMQPIPLRDKAQCQIGHLASWLPTALSIDVETALFFAARVVDSSEQQQLAVKRDFLATIDRAAWTRIAAVRGLVAATARQTLFLSGLLSSSFYKACLVTDLLALLTEDEWQQAVTLDRFKGLTQSLRIQQSLATLDSPFSNIHRCDLLAAKWIDASWLKQPQSEADFLSAFRPLHWPAFETFSPQRQAYYLLIGYLDTLEIYTRMHQDLLQKIFAASSTTTEPSRAIVEPAILTQAASFLSAQHVTWSAITDSTKLTRTTYQNLLHMYPRHPDLAFYESLLPLAASPAAPFQPDESGEAGTTDRASTQPGMPDAKSSDESSCDSWANDASFVLWTFGTCLMLSIL